MNILLVAHQIERVVEIGVQVDIDQVGFENSQSPTCPADSDQQAREVVLV